MAGIVGDLHHFLEDRGGLGVEGFNRVGLGEFLGEQSFLGILVEIGFLGVGIHAMGDQLELRLGVEALFRTFGVLGDGARKGLGTRKEALLEVGEDDERAIPNVDFLAFDLLDAQGLVAVHHFTENKLGGVGWEAINIDLLDHALGEAAGEKTDVAFEPADHDVVKVRLGDGDALNEALGVEDIEEGGETVRMTVMWGGAEE